MEIMNKRWSDEHFYKVREEVLKQWPTGEGLKIEDGVEYQKNISFFNSNISKVFIALKGTWNLYLYAYLFAVCD